MQKRFWLKFTAAASILFGLLFLGYHYRLIYEQDKPLPFVLKAQDDIPAGGKKALLILSNGKRLILDSIGQNRLFDENGIRISRLDDGQLRYTVDADFSHNPKIFNTIQTPTGGNYQIVLHDGTKVWLNAMSTLKFPTAFSPTERTVELTGEAYFEVAHDKSKPFTVNVNNVVVKVLGTHFNINSYTKSTKVATTVLEGAVAVSGGSVALPKTVLPGSTLSYNILNETMYLQKNVDIEEIVAWKDGYFNASSISLKQLMEEVSRWYGVAIIYQTNNRETEFVGKLPKNISLKDLLTLLELAGELKFNLTSKTVTIMDK